jgi:hypothetical protein
MVAKLNMLEQALYKNLKTRDEFFQDLNTRTKTKTSRIRTKEK